MRHAIALAAALLSLAGCANPSTGVSTASLTGAGLAPSVTYSGLTIDLKDLPDGKNLTVAFQAPNVIMSAHSPDAAVAGVDYVITTDQDPTHPFHVPSDEADAAFRVSVPIMRFRAGEYTLEAYANGQLAPFAKAGLHISGMDNAPTAN